MACLSGTGRLALALANLRLRASHATALFVFRSKVRKWCIRRAAAVVDIPLLLADVSRSRALSSSRRQPDEVAIISNGIIAR